MSESAATSTSEIKFWNGPQPCLGPDVAYKNEAASNPVLRGHALSIVAAIISFSSYVQKLLWHANGFEKLREIKVLENYEPRYDPTVIPILDSAALRSKTVADLPLPRPRQNGSSYYTCADYHALYKSRKLTPIEVVESLLPLIRRDTSPPGKHSVAFLESQVDIILAAAKASTQRYEEGKPLSALDGVPLAVKDEADLGGYKRTLGSKMDFTNPANQTAWCVQKWEEAGGIVLGKTNMHEIGLDTTNNNPNTGTPLNPHNTKYYTGGSSGGSAYVVASGICPIALGVDGGGSIRLPASFCGVYGLKPSHGRVSGHPTRDLGCSVGVYGPMASSVDDLALAYRIMGQPDPQNRQSASFPSPLDTYLSPSSSHEKILGLCPAWISRASPIVHSLFTAAIDHYTSPPYNYRTVDIAIPLLPESQKAHALTILSEIRSGFTTSQISHLTLHNQLLLNVAGSHASAQDFLFSQRLRDLCMRHLMSLWEKYPGMIIVTPTTPEAGWKIGKESDVKVGGTGVSDGDASLRSMEYVFLANFTGNPAISLPMGYTEENVPVGLMGMGIWGAEEQLLDFAREGEGLLGEPGVRHPKLEGSWVDVLSG